jgi:glucosamine--fructose-6-phosphate aminotransferase (isomerizing)
MCGIFAVSSSNDSPLNRSELTGFKSIAFQSERRGSDASGLLIQKNGEITIFKSDSGIRYLWKSLVDSGSRFMEDASTCIGHTRLSTHGETSDESNNQPSVSKNWVVVHNGIILDHTEILQGSEYESNDLDTYVINYLLENCKGNYELLQNELNSLEGEISFIAISSYAEILCYTNVGNLYISVSEKIRYLASEPIFLEQVSDSKVSPVSKGEVIVFRGKQTDNPIKFSIRNDSSGEDTVAIPSGRKSQGDTWNEIKAIGDRVLEKYSTVKRCVICVLPETFPQIEFNGDGVCTFCTNWKLPVFLGELELKNKLLGLTNKEKKILVNLSGGRDSTYALAKLHDLGFQPIAFTYDWGFISNAARENMSRFCQKYQVEHVLVSPNIRKNRALVKTSLETWFKHPDVGVIPLLMAGDKPFHTISMKVSRERGNIPIIHSDHYLETTGFKSVLGGARVKFSDNNIGVEFRLSPWSIFLMSIRYLMFIMRAKKNKIELLKQVASSFIAYYVTSHKFIHFFQYYAWNEVEIDKRINLDGWQNNSRKHSAKWRMGDLTAPMYNLLYSLNLGFTENDAMLSNQIRANLISRTYALKKLQELNKIDYDGISEYLEIISVAPDNLLNYLRKLSQHI